MSAKRGLDISKASKVVNDARSLAANEKGLAVDHRLFRAVFFHESICLRTNRRITLTYPPQNLRWYNLGQGEFG